MPDSTSSHVEVPPAARFPPATAAKIVERPSRVCGAVSGGAVSSAPLAYAAPCRAPPRRAPLSRVRRHRCVTAASRVTAAPLPCAAAQVCDGRQPCNGRPSRVCGGVSRRAVSGGAVSGGAVSSAPLACAAAWPAASNARRHQRSSARLEGAVSCRAVSGGAVSGGDSPGCAPLCIDRSHAPKSRVLGALSASSQPAFMNQRPCR